MCPKLSGRRGSPATHEGALGCAHVENYRSETALPIGTGMENNAWTYASPKLAQVSFLDQLLRRASFCVRRSAQHTTRIPDSLSSQKLLPIQTPPPSSVTLSLGHSTGVRLPGKTTLPSPQNCRLDRSGETCCLISLAALPAMPCSVRIRREEYPQPSGKCSPAEPPRAPQRCRSRK
jgi:hypothetical protein